MTDEEYEQFQKEVAATIADSVRLTLSSQETIAKAFELDAAIAEVCRQLEGFDPLPDAPLSLIDAICLPELGGILYRHGDSQPSTSVTVKTLRTAIERGQLAATRLNSKNLYITRRQVQEWIASCQDIRKSPISSNEQHAIIRRESSHTRPSGSSTTERNERALDAALMILKELK